MADSGVPETLSDLLARVPPSNVSGVLSREILPPGETVLYETRPGLLSLYGGRVIFTVVWSALFIAFGIEIDDFWGGFLLSLPALIWLGYLLAQWRNRVYALTDQRVIRISGVTGSVFQDTMYGQVQNFAIESGGLQFDFTPPVSVGTFVGLARRRVLHWNSVSDPPRVYTFVQQAFTLVLHRDHERALTEATLNRIQTASIRCAYCGGLIDLTTLDRLNARCPQCRAPVILPS